MREYKSKLGTALTAILILSGCGGSSTSESPTPEAVTLPPAPNEPTASAPPARNILEAASQKSVPLVKDSESTVAPSPLSGVAAKGVIGGARVIVFDALTPPEDVGEDGAVLLGEGVTNPDGTYSLSLQTTEETSEYLVVGTFFDGATMICDAPSGCFNGVAFGERMTLGESDEALWAVFPKPVPGEAAIANLNLLTHFQLFRMLGIAYDEQLESEETDDPITLKAKHYSPAFDFVSNAFGLETEPFHTIPYIDATKPIGSSNQNAINMGLLSAGYLEAGIQAEIASNGEEANFDEVLSESKLLFLLPEIFLPINENDFDKNQRSVSLEDIFEGALKAAELNTSQTNSLSLAIDWLTEQNEVIDTVPYDGRLEADGSYPEERISIEEPEPETDPEPELETDPEPETDPETDPNPDPHDGTAGNESCRPALSPTATDEIVLLSGYEGTALSSVAVTSLDRETEVTRVRIETGESPLYILAASFTDMVWSIEGDTDRVAGFVAATGQKPPNSAAAGGVGVVGLPNEKVDFIDYECMPRYNDSGSSAIRVVQNRYEGLFKRDIDHLLSAYTLSSVAIPSGDMIDQITRDEIEAVAIAAGQTHIEADNGITFNIKSQTDYADQTQLFRFTEEGLATVPANQVVSPKLIQTYDVFPAHAGLVQLLSSGHLEYKGRDNSYVYSYFIHETFPRFPAGLTGAHSVKFVLGTGVEMPSGDVGHSRVYSEETGECLKGAC